VAPAAVLKGADLGDVMGDITPLLIILAVFSTLALLRFRRTPD
jgi:hypothetical protein